MMLEVIIAENALEPASWENFETEDLVEFLFSFFNGKWPDTARIYHDQVSEANDVTPSDEGTVDKLSELTGRFYVVVYPGDPTTIIIAVLAVAAAGAAAFLLAPAIPGVTNRNQQSSSPNNELSNRSNRARPNERINDIFGQVICIPDLIAVPYKIFEDNIEVEYAYMCIGRGAYEVSNIKDDTTPIQYIEGSKVTVFPPYRSPNQNTDIQIEIGGPINTPIYNVQRSNAVNGQTLRPPNANNVVGSDNIRALGNNTLEIKSDSGVDFRDYFQPGQTVTIANLSFTSGGITPTTYNLSGNFPITGVSEFSMTITPNGTWNSFGSNVGNSGYKSPTLSRTEVDWIGPFIIQKSDLTFANFVAASGLFKDDGENQFPVYVQIDLGITPVDANDNPIAGEFIESIVMSGSASNRETRAQTLKTGAYGGNRLSVRARRASNTDLGFDGQVVDEIKWRDLYSVSNVPLANFGDVTTVQSVTVATDGALNIKDRKLNMLVTRKLPQWTGSGFTSQLYPARIAHDIISFICLDQKIGNRQYSEVDFNSIYSTVTDVNNYFGNIQSCLFDYTFDDNNISFEETISAMAASIFSTAYRRGSVLKLQFEKQTENSTILFNHRNKLPGSETRTIRFGNQDDNDGVELEYISPVDGATLTYYIPEDRSAINPKSIKTVGIRSRLQAYFHAKRAWNKIRYQNTATQFEATQEADLLVLKDRILVTDNTRSDSQDGEVYAQNGLELTLSQPIQFSGGGYSIMLQHVDGTVEILPVSPVSGDAYKVVLGQAPRAALALDSSLYARTTFAIVGTNSRKTLPFLVTEKSANSNFTLEITAINYDNRYYQNDKDYINGIINADGN